MDRRRTALACLAVAALLALVALLIPDGEAPRTGDATRRHREEQRGAPVLRGHEPTAPRTDVAASSPTPSDKADEEHHTRLARHEIVVLDYRSAAVEGVRVFLERDWNDYRSGQHVRGWRVLDTSTSDERGRVRLAADPTRREDLMDGINHRIRVDPPDNREDLAPTWRIWKPAATEVFRFVQSHVVEGVVVDASGKAIAAATVFLGDMPDGDFHVINPEWMKTTTGPEGRFRFSAIPTTRGWTVDVWAVREGEAQPRSSRDVKDARTVALDDRHVEIRLR